jgi:hypothetical protein
MNVHARAEDPCHEIAFRRGQGETVRGPGRCGSGREGSGVPFHAGRIGLTEGDPI